MKQGMGAFGRRVWLRPLATLAFVVILATVFSPKDGRTGFLIFWKAENLANVLRQVSETGILAVGMTLVIISGGIDLSVGSLLGLSGTVFAYGFVTREWPLGVAVALGLMVTCAFGLVSGLVIARLKMPPFIVTLAAMIGSRGFARRLVDNANIDISFGDDYIGRVVDFFAQKSFVVSSFFIVAVLGLVLLRGTRFGRHLVAIGGSEEAARLSGAGVEWVKVRVYLLCGLFAGVAGILHCCQNHQGNANSGLGYELDAIAAAVVGGTNLSGGKGGVFGTIVGAVALGIVSNLLGLRNVDENIQWMLKAVIILLAVWLQSLGMKRTA